ncbi:aspartyl-phosphate phosphatase Spo0E family protein [Brevibacillus sp. SYSU BS000544]|uniref:aspartyl-phosphate phosphatase Spo0E family protein n=1 Tax=Brevibacillus sp. SYSU BS000544 TaxID=3416443 RepID=UPI003CE548FC
MNSLLIEPLSKSMKSPDYRNVLLSTKRRKTIDSNKALSRQINRKKATNNKIINKFLLEQIIEDLRKRLNQLASERSLSDHLVIQLSQELDLYIVQYQKMTQKREYDR